MMWKIKMLIMNGQRMKKRKIIGGMKRCVMRTTTRKSESTPTNIEKNRTLFCLVNVGLRTEETDISRKNEMCIERKKFMRRTTIGRSKTPVSLTVTSNNNCTG